MSTPQIAAWARQQLDTEPWEPDPEDRFYEMRQAFIGTVFGLDPCGRYHHMLSPNGVTARCISFWESLERQCEKRGMSLTCGEGDPCDNFVAEYRMKEGSEEDEEATP